MTMPFDPPGWQGTCKDSKGPKNGSYMAGGLGMAHAQPASSKVAHMFEKAVEDQMEGEKKFTCKLSQNPTVQQSDNQLLFYILIIQEFFFFFAISKFSLKKKQNALKPKMKNNNNKIPEVKKRVKGGKITQNG